MGAVDHLVVGQRRGLPRSAGHPAPPHASAVRHAGKLYHIGAGRTHTGTRILLLVHDLHIRIINAATGELLRDLTLDPDRNYQPLGRPPGPTPGTPRKRKNPGP